MMYFWSAVGLGGKGPLETGRKGRAAAAAQTGILDLLDDRGRRHAGDRFTQRGVAVMGDVLLDGLGIDHAAIAEHHPLLRAVVIGLGVGDDAVRPCLAVDQSLDHPALEQMLLDDGRYVRRPHLGVGRSLRINDQDRPLVARTQATGLDDLDLFRQTLAFDLRQESLLDRAASPEYTRSTAADQDMRPIECHCHASLLRLIARPRRPYGGSHRLSP